MTESYILIRQIESAIAEKRNEVLEAIISDNPVLLNGANPQGETPLHAALFCGNFQAARFLIERGADVNAKDMQGQTPLHFIISYPKWIKGDGTDETARMLIDKGALIDSFNKFGHSPLHEAINIGKKDAVPFLLEHGADPLLKNDDGKTALEMARSSAVDQTSVVKRLEEFLKRREEEEILKAREAAQKKAEQEADERLASNISRLDQILKKNRPMP